MVNWSVCTRCIPDMSETWTFMFPWISRRYHASAQMKLLLQVTRRDCTATSTVKCSAVMCGGHCRQVDRHISNTCILSNLLVFVTITRMSLRINFDRVAACQMMAASADKRGVWQIIRCVNSIKCDCRISHSQMLLVSSAKHPCVNRLPLGVVHKGFCIFKSLSLEVFVFVKDKQQKHMHKITYKHNTK